MPVRNEERHLAEAVSHVLSQDYSGALELVLAVGPSEDKTEHIAERLAAADPRITVVANPSGHIPAGLNAAVKASRHDLVIRVDGHALLPPGYIATAVRTLAETGAVNVGGVMAAEGITPFQRAVAWAMTAPAGVGSAKYHTGGEPGPASSVYLGAFRRSAVDGVGGYDEQYLRAEDWELRYLAPPAAVLAIGAGTLAGVAGLLALAAGTRGVLPWALIAFFAVPLVYLLGLLGVTAIAARALRGRALASLPVVLATMHMSWGIGFLASPRRIVPRASQGGPA